MKAAATFGIACLLTAGLGAQIPDLTPRTGLLSALVHNDIREAGRLLEAGADPNEGRFVGFPPLFLAVMRQDLSLVRLMAGKGADLHARDGSGSTALMWSAFSESGDDTLVMELLRLGADPLASNNTGETALTWALRRGDTPAAAALRRAGAADRDRRRLAVEKAISLLQRSGAQFTRVSGFSSCHHQLLPMMAFGIARTRGLAVD
jgi:ankyrin repeat protein